MAVNIRRLALRRATAEAHARLDASVGDFRSLTAYGRFLQGLAAGRPAIEAYVNQDEAAPWRTTALRKEIEADLADLGLARRAIRPLGALPGDPSSRLGAAYVLEGSALGARLLYQRAREIGLGPSFGARHLATQVAAPENWKHFLRTLECVEPYDAQIAAEAARAVFGHMQAAMEGIDDGR